MASGRALTSKPLLIASHVGPSASLLTGPRGGRERLCQGSATSAFLLSPAMNTVSDMTDCGLAD